MWMVRQNVPSESLQMTKNRETADTPENAVIQRDLGNVEKWIDEKLMKFNKEKCCILILRKNKPRHRTG